MNPDDLNTDERSVHRLVFNAIRLKEDPERSQMAEALIRRLFEGRRDYGPLDLDNDSRDFAYEGGQEGCDGADYAAMVAIQKAWADEDNTDALKAIDHFVEAWRLLGGRA